MTELRRTLAAVRPDVVCWWRMGELSLSLVEHVRRAGLPAVGVVCDQWLLDGPARDPWQRPWQAGSGPAARGTGGPRSHRTRRFEAIVSPAARLVGPVSRLPVEVDWSAAAEWLFVSKWLRDHTLAHGPPLARTQIAHAGIDLGGLPLRDAPPPWRGRLLYAGRLSAPKGADDAVAALTLLPEATTLTVHGHGTPAELDRLRESARHAGVAARVRFGGALSRFELAAAYAAHDALLFCSRWDEPWGLVPLEAMAVGLPVVASGTGGSAEYLDFGANALYAAPGDVGAIAGAVRALAEDPALRHRLARAGRVTAERFAAEACDARVLARLEAAVAQH